MENVSEFCVLFALCALPFRKKKYAGHVINECVWFCGGNTLMLRLQYYNIVLVVVRHPSIFFQKWQH